MIEPAVEGSPRTACAFAMTEGGDARHSCFYVARCCPPPGHLRRAQFGRPPIARAGAVGEPAERAGKPAELNALAAILSTASAGVLHGDRVNQLDLRFDKILRFGQRRAAVNLDVYNVANSSPVVTESQAYATFRMPQTVLIGRFIKVGTQLDF